MSAIHQEWSVSHVIKSVSNGFNISGIYSLIILATVVVSTLVIGTFNNESLLMIVGFVAMSFVLALPLISLVCLIIDVPIED